MLFPDAPRFLRVSPREISGHSSHSTREAFLSSLIYLFAPNIEASILILFVLSLTCQAVVSALMLSWLNILSHVIFFLSNRPIGAPGSSRRYRQGGNRTPSGATLSRVGGAGSLQRVRSTRSTGVIDPDGLVGRRIWRYYPDEDPERPWVEGFITDWDKMSNLYTILYDPNTSGESTEDFAFDTAAAADYVLGDYYDINLWNGSQRVAQRPQSVSVPPMAATAPSKRRRSSVRIPAVAPFQPTWFETALYEANHDDLQSMLSLLDAREMELAAAIEAEEEAIAMGEDAGQRCKLENDFFELCRKEESIMEQLRQLREEEE